MRLARYATHFGMTVLQETPRFVLLGSDGGASIGFHVGDPLETEITSPPPP
jgi:hypothetical protein